MEWVVAGVLEVGGYGCAVGVWMVCMGLMHIHEIVHDWNGEYIHIKYTLGNTGSGWNGWV